MRKTLSFFYACLLGSTALSQGSVTNGVYSQNFDDLAITGSNIPWVDNNTLPNWYSHHDSPYPNLNGPVPNLFNGAGSRAQLAIYGASDVAFGSGNNFSEGVVSFGVRLVNNTGALVTNFSVGYIGEQWSRSANSIQVSDSLSFSYNIFNANMGSLSAEGWISVPSLDFISPNTALATEALLDGNAPENQMELFGDVTGIALAEGQELWLRWTATSTEAFNDHDLAIDDLVVTFGAIPEPTTYTALLSGLTALAVITRRRTRDKWDNR